MLICGATVPLFADLSLTPVIDRFDAETNVDRTTAFKAVLDKISKMDEESQTLEHMAEMLESLLYMVLNEENGEGDS